MGRWSMGTICVIILKTVLPYHGQIVPWRGRIYLSTFKKHYTRMGLNDPRWPHPADRWRTAWFCPLFINFTTIGLHVSQTFFLSLISKKEEKTLQKNLLEEYDKNYDVHKVFFSPWSSCISFIWGIMYLLLVLSADGELLKSAYLTLALFTVTDR